MKKIEQMIKKCPTMIVSLTIIGCMMVCYIFQKDKTISELEQRNLQQLPSYTTPLFISGDYQREFNSYIKDQMPLRDKLFKNKVRMEYTLGKRKFDDIWVGKDHMLFQDMYVPTKKDIEERKKSIITFQQKYKKLNIGIALVSNKAEIYSEKIPKEATTIDQGKVISNLYSSLEKEHIKTVSLEDVLLSHKDETIFYNSDHHWTSRGAYLAFQEIRKNFIRSKKQVAYNTYVINDTFDGSLSKQSGYMTNKDKVNVYLPKSKDSEVDVVVNYVNERKKTATVYDVDKATSANPYEVFLGGNYDCIEIDTSVKNDKSLLLIKDSFANCLIPFLLPYYHHISVVDPRYYSDDIYTLIKEDNISDVLFLYNFQTFFQDDLMLDLFE